MKKLLIMLVVFFSISLFAESMYVAPKLQLGYGFGDAHDLDDVTTNPGFGGGVIFGYNVMPELAVEANLSVEYWLVDAPEGIDASVINIPIMLGANYHFNEMFGGLAGVALRVAMPSMEVGDVDVELDSRFEFGFYVGGDIVFDNFFVRPTFNYILGGEQKADGTKIADADNDTYVLIELGYKFGL